MAPGTKCSRWSIIRHSVLPYYAHIYSVQPTVAVVSPRPSLPLFVRLDRLVSPTWRGAVPSLPTPAIRALLLKQSRFESRLPSAVFFPEASTSLHPEVALAPRVLHRNPARPPRLRFPRALGLTADCLEVLGRQSATQQRRAGPGGTRRHGDEMWRRTGRAAHSQGGRAARLVRRLGGHCWGRRARQGGHWHMGGGLPPWRPDGSHFRTYAMKRACDKCK